MTSNNLSKSPNLDESSSGKSEGNSPRNMVGNITNGQGVTRGNTLLPPYNGNMKLGEVPNFNVIPPPLPLIYYGVPLPLPLLGQGQGQILGSLPMPQMHQHPQLLQPMQSLPYDIQPTIPPPSHLVSLPVPESQLQLDSRQESFPNKKKIKKNSRRKHRNSHLGCGTCKKRRIKCDETLPACHNCLKGKLHCAYLNLDSNAQAALRMAQYNQLLRQEKLENSVPNEKSSTTSPKPISPNPNPIPSPKQIYPYQTYQIPQIMPQQPMMQMNQQIPPPPPIPMQHPVQPNGMVYMPQNVQFPPLQNMNRETQNQDVKLPPIKKLTHDLDKVPKISNLLL